MAVVPRTVGTRARCIVWDSLGRCFCRLSRGINEFMMKVGVLKTERRETCYALDKVLAEIFK